MPQEANSAPTPIDRNDVRRVGAEIEGLNDADSREARRDILTASQEIIKLFEDPQRYAPAEKKHATLNNMKELAVLMRDRYAGFKSSDTASEDEKFLTGKLTRTLNKEIDLLEKRLTNLEQLSLDDKAVTYTFASGSPHFGQGKEGSLRQYFVDKETLEEQTYEFADLSLEVENKYKSYQLKLLTQDGQQSVLPEPGGEPVPLYVGGQIDGKLRSLKLGDLSIRTRPDWGIELDCSECELADSDIDAASKLNLDFLSLEFGINGIFDDLHGLGKVGVEKKLSLDIELKDFAQAQEAIKVIDSAYEKVNETHNFEAYLQDYHDQHGEQILKEAFFATLAKTDKLNEGGVNNIWLRLSRQQQEEFYAAFAGDASYSMKDLIWLDADTDHRVGMTNKFNLTETIKLEVKKKAHHDAATLDDKGELSNAVKSHMMSYINDSQQIASVLHDLAEQAIKTDLAEGLGQQKNNLLVTLNAYYKEQLIERREHTDYEGIYDQLVHAKGIDVTYCFDQYEGMMQEKIKAEIEKVCSSDRVIGHAWRGLTRQDGDGARRDFFVHELCFDDYKPVRPNSTKISGLYWKRWLSSGQLAEEFRSQLLQEARDKAMSSEELESRIMQLLFDDQQAGVGLHSSAYLEELIDQRISTHIGRHMRVQPGEQSSIRDEFKKYLKYIDQVTDMPYERAYHKLERDLRIKEKLREIYDQSYEQLHKDTLYEALAQHPKTQAERTALSDEQKERFYQRMSDSRADTSLYPKRKKLKTISQVLKSHTIRKSELGELYKQHIYKLLAEEFSNLDDPDVRKEAKTLVKDQLDDAVELLRGKLDERFNEHIARDITSKETNLYNELNKMVLDDVLEDDIHFGDTYTEKASISDMERVNRISLERQVAEQLRQRYARNADRPLGQLDRVWLFLNRRRIYNRMLRQAIEEREQEGFGREDQETAAADRHELEEQYAWGGQQEDIEVIGQITEDNYPATKQQIDNLVEQYLQNNMQRPDFQQRFEDIIMHQPPFDRTPPSGWTGDWQQLPELMATHRLHQVSSNVGMKVELFRAHRELVDQIRAIAVTTGLTQAAERTERIRELVRDYYETYDQVPRFLQELGIDISHEHALHRLKNHHQALSQIAGQTLDLRVQLLANGHEAYAIRDEEDRPLARRIGEFLDNPWVGAGTFSLPVVSSLIFGWPAGLTGAGVYGLYYGTKTLFKKFAHYSREHREHEQARVVEMSNYERERAQLEQEMGTGGFVRGWQPGFLWFNRRRRERWRQLRYYAETMHDQLERSQQLSTQINEQIRLQQRDGLDVLLVRVVARLDYHREVGSSFLGSDQAAQAEQDLQRLQRVIDTGMNFLDLTIDDLRNHPQFAAMRDHLRRGSEDQIGHEESERRFRSRRRRAAFWGALKTGLLSGGLSYLAGKLFNTETKEIVTEGPTQEEAKLVGEQYSRAPGEFEEAVLTSGDLSKDVHTVLSSDVKPDSTIEFRYAPGVDEIRYVSTPPSMSDLHTLAGSIKAKVTTANGFSSANIAELTRALSRPEIQAMVDHATTAGATGGNEYLFARRGLESIETLVDEMISTGTTSNDLTIIQDLGSATATPTAGAGAAGSAAQREIVAEFCISTPTQESHIETVVRPIAVLAIDNTFQRPSSRQGEQSGESQA